MQTQKLYLLIEAFTQAEHIQFAKFLDSPLHNQRDDCTQLYKWLKSELAEGRSPDMTALHTRFFPGMPFDGAEMRLRMNYLLRRMERFLALRELLADEVGLELKVLDIYRRRKLGKLYDGQLIRLKNMEKAGIRENEDHFLHTYTLESTRFNAVVERSQASETALHKLNVALDQYYFLQKLKAACSALTMRKLFPGGHSDPLLPVLVQQIESQQLDQVPAIGLFYAAYQVLDGQNADQAFVQLKALLPQSTAIFSDEDCRALYRIALNHCIGQINRGDRQFLTEAFELYAAGLESGALLENGMLSPWTYKNIALAGLRIGQQAWVATFIENYRERLPESFRDAFYHYNLAELALARSEFQTVVRHLRDLSFKDPFMTLNARVTQIKALYELEEFKLIDYQLPNMNALLRRRALQSYHRDNYRNFLHYLGALVNLVHGDHETGRRLIVEMEAEEHLSELEWLRKKMAAVAGISLA